MLTRDQEYASRIYSQLEPLANGNDKYRKTYGSFAHALPILIHRAGLVQALTFLSSREKTEPGVAQPASAKLLADMAEVLGYANADSLLGACRTLHLNGYIQLTQRALRALIWYKRFAQSVLKVEPDEEKEGEV